jgi:hypothetical protein
VGLNTIVEFLHPVHCLLEATTMHWQRVMSSPLSTRPGDFESVTVVDVHK